VGQATYAVDRWFPGRATPRTGTLLFCLPYAGGSATAFHGWHERLPQDVACLPVQLPGRGARFDEPPTIDINELSRAISDRAAGQPFAILGHSMGARLAFEVTRQLRRVGAALPVALFVSGARPPHMDTPLSRIARLPDDDFCKRLLAMGGTPTGLLDDAEMRALLLPVLRADFAMVESYRYRREPPLPTPILVTAGSDDPEADPCDMTGWSAHTTAHVHLETFPGNHFFLHSAQSAVLSFVARELDAVCLSGTDRAASPPDRTDVADVPSLASLAALADDEVLVVEARLDELVELSGAVRELSPGEQRRAASLAVPAEAARFITRSVLLRRLLRAGGINVGIAEMARGPGGKPAVAHRSGLRFNVSQSADRVLIALAPGREVGVDLELLSAATDTDSMAAKYLDDEERDALTCLPEDEVPISILRTATAKSAVLKAIGDLGVASPRDFGFGARRSRPWRVQTTRRPDGLAAWRVHHLDLADAVGALAIGPGDVRLRYHLVRGGGS